MEEMRLPSAFKAPKLSNAADEADRASAFSKPSPTTVSGVSSADANTTTTNAAAMPHIPFSLSTMPPMEFFQHFQQAALQAMARNMTPATIASTTVPTTSTQANVSPAPPIDATSTSAAVGGEAAAATAAAAASAFNGSIPPMMPFGFPAMPNFFGYPPSPYPFSPAFIPSPASFLPSFSGKRKRRHRTIFSEDQLTILENTFAETPYPDVGMREKLALQCDLKEERVEVWFKNRRAKKRKMDREGAHDNTGGSRSSDGKDASDLSDYSSDNEDVDRAAAAHPHNNHNGGSATNNCQNSSASHSNNRRPTTSQLTASRGRRANNTTTVESYENEEEEEEEKIIITPSKNVKTSSFNGKTDRSFNGVAATSAPRVTTNGGFGSGVALKRKMMMNRNVSPSARFAAPPTNGRADGNSDAKRVRGATNSIATGTTKFKPVSELFKD